MWICIWLYNNTQDTSLPSAARVEEITSYITEQYEFCFILYFFWIDLFILFDALSAWVAVEYADFISAEE